MDWVRPQVVPWHHDHAYLDWPTHSSSDPIRWRPCADPGQKQELGDWMTQKGIDLSRPVTEELGDWMTQKGIDLSRPVTEELGDWMTQKGIDLSRPVTEALLWQIAFMPHAVERFSAVRASLQWSGDEIDDGVTYSRQAWLRRWTVDSFLTEYQRLRSITTLADF